MRKPEWGHGAAPLAVIVVVVSLAAAACGSTYKPTAAERAAEGGGVDAAATGDAGSGTGSSSGSGALSGSAAGSNGSSTGAGRGAAGGRPGSGSTAVTGVKSGRIPVGKGVHGVTDTTIDVGLWYLNSAAANAAIAAFGSAKLDENTDPKAGIQVTVDYLNSHGGIAGRKVNPVMHEINAGAYVSRSGADQDAQATCSDWTEDHHVFAFEALPRGEGMWDCAARSNTPVIYPAFGILGSNQWMWNANVPKYRDVWYSPDYPTVERRDKNMVEGLWQQGFFKGETKVGIFAEDTPGAKEGVEKVMIPALAAHGITDVNVVTYSDPIQSQWSTYVFTMNSNRIQRVLMSATEGWSFGASLAMQAADQQGYYPHWGIASDQGPAGLASLSAPTSELQNTFGVGWVPMGDVGDVTPHTATAKLCNEIDEKAGLPSLTNRMHCEFLLFLKYVLERAPEISPKGMTAAMNAVGDSWIDADTVLGKTLLSSTRHDGPAMMRYFAYDPPNCDSSKSSTPPCFKYVSDPLPMQ